MSRNNLMPFEPHEVGQLIETIWTVVLDCSVQSIPLPAGGQDLTDSLTGMIEITGAWEGIVALECPRGFVRQAASLVFEMEPDLVTRDQLEDTLCELTNIIGGNFKALLPPSTHLGLPAVAEDASCCRRIAVDRAFMRLAFETSGFVFFVSILSSAAASDDPHRQLLVTAPKA